NYSSGWFTLFNPWGVNNGSQYPGLIEADGGALADNFNSWAHNLSSWAKGDAVAGLGTAPVTSVPGFFVTDTKAPVASPALTARSTPNVLEAHTGFQADNAMLAALCAVKHGRAASPLASLDAAMVGAFAELDGFPGV